MDNDGLTDDERQEMADNFVKKIDSFNDESELRKFLSATIQPAENDSHYGEMIEHMVADWRQRKQLN